MLHECLSAGLAWKKKQNSIEDGGALKSIKGATRKLVCTLFCILFLYLQFFFSMDMLLDTALHQNSGLFWFLLKKEGM